MHPTANHITCIKYGYLNRRPIIAPQHSLQTRILNNVTVMTLGCSLPVRQYLSTPPHSALLVSFTMSPSSPELVQVPVERGTAYDLTWPRLQSFQDGS